mgnify:CR=1 FL=1
MIPYGRQTIEAEDADAVAEAVRAAFLTTGPTVPAFERAFTDAIAPGQNVQAIAVATGTAALHLMLRGLDIGPGDEVIVPALTFAATANAAIYVGARPVFADVDPATLLLDPVSAGDRVTDRTRAIIGVDYAGQPCDWAALRRLADDHGLALLADGCHAPGACVGTTPVGALADATSFSFHPVKHLTTAEGGMITTADARLAERLRHLRHHAMERTDPRRPFHYDITELGYNYRLSDLQCALGLAQVSRLSAWLARRRAIAAHYDAAFANVAGIDPLDRRDGTTHAYHLYVIRLSGPLAAAQAELAVELRDAGIGTAVHYPPLTHTTLYAAGPGGPPAPCPVAEAAYGRILSIPMFPGLDDTALSYVSDTIARIAAGLC